MNPRFPRRIPADLMDRLRVETAVASEQVLEEHVRSAVEMVEEGGDRAPIERLIAAYARLHHLAGPDARKLHERVLATLGRSRTELGPVAGPRFLLSRILRRLRGRINQDLREWVERHTARVELTVLEIHVENALRTLNVLQDTVPVGRAITIYSEMLELRPTAAEIVRLKVLKALHDTRSGHVEPLRPGRAAPPPLRVENDR